jgi:hypothetical protein
MSVLPYAISAWSGYQRNELLINSNGEKSDDKQLLSFREKKDKLAEIVALLSLDRGIQSIVTFDPAKPQTNMVHGYLRADESVCNKALDIVEKDTGIRVLKRVRPLQENDLAYKAGYYSSFEWAMGEYNANISNDLFVKGWSEFSRVLRQLLDQTRG